MKDWAVRAVKTFIQAFFGVFIPALCAMLQNGWPESLSKAWVILAPTVAAALAAAICAVWNIVLEALETTPKPTHEEMKPPDINSEDDGGRHE